MRTSRAKGGGHALLGELSRALLTLCSNCSCPERRVVGHHTAFSSFCLVLGWSCQGAEFGDSFWVWFASKDVWLGVGFPWRERPTALHFFWVLVISPHCPNGLQHGTVLQVRSCVCHTENGDFVGAQPLQ